MTEVASALARDRWRFVPMAGWIRSYDAPAGARAGHPGFRGLDEHPGDDQFAGVVVFRLDGGLFFATSNVDHAVEAQTAARGDSRADA